MRTVPQAKSPAFCRSARSENRAFRRSCHLSASRGAAKCDVFPRETPVPHVPQTVPQDEHRERFSTVPRSASPYREKHPFCGTESVSGQPLPQSVPQTRSLVPTAALLAAVRAGVPAFVREVEVFDQYRGKGVEPGQKSLALRIVMQDTDRTLTDSEVESVVSAIRNQLIEQFQAQPRT